MTALVYRTTNPSEWGTGQGSDLTATQIDMNFWILESSIVALQDHALTNENQIAFFSVVGNQLYVTMADHTVFGPFTLPTASWNFRGAWLPGQSYAPMDVVTDNNSAYLVLFAHTSAATFDAGANDGDGHSYYGLLITGSTGSGLPDGGTVGQALLVTVAGTETEPPTAAWGSLTRLVGIFIPGALTSDNEVIFEFIAVENMTFPIGFAGSRASPATQPTMDQTYNIYKNGAFVGQIEFFPSGPPAFSLSAATTFAPGDILAMIGPASPGPDPHMTDISITLVATLP